MMKGLLMAKIFKTCRKLHKTKQDVYVDAMVKFWRDLERNKPTPMQQIPHKKQLLKTWKKAGGTTESFERVGIQRAFNLLKQRGKI